MHDLHLYGLPYSSHTCTSYIFYSLGSVTIDVTLHTHVRVTSSPSIISGSLYSLLFTHMYELHRQICTTQQHTSRVLLCNLYMYMIVRAVSTRLSTYPCFKTTDFSDLLSARNYQEIYDRFPFALRRGSISSL